MEFLNPESPQRNKHTRKTFLLAGLSLAAISTFFWGRKESAKKKNTVKFLAQDGSLVEIDADKLPAKRRTASTADIKNWIKK